jgi:hypothetical protein
MGVTTEFPANIRRRLILEAEERSVSSDEFDKGPAR